MGTVKNVEMNYFNGVDYDVIRPGIVLENVSDFNSYMESNYYDKSEIDTKISESISKPIGWGEVGTYHFTTGSNTGIGASVGGDIFIENFFDIHYQYWFYHDLKFTVNSSNNSWTYYFEIESENERSHLAYLNLYGNTGRNQQVPPIFWQLFPVANSIAESSAYRGYFKAISYTTDSSSLIIVSNKNLKISNGIMLGNSASGTVSITQSDLIVYRSRVNSFP